MTKEEILESNKLIANFMQYKVTEFQFRNWKTLVFCDEDDYIDIRDISYFTPNNNWNDLMPVVEKIESLCIDVTILRQTCRIATWERNFNQECLSNESKIHATYSVVVEFIKWYYSQQKRQKEN
jgi:hypothetical protein